MKVGDIIKHYRIQQKMTQHELSSAICSITYLSKLENNKLVPSEEILALICSRLQLSLEKLYQAEDIKLKEELFQFYKYTQLKHTEEAAKLYDKLSAIFNEAHQSISMELYFDLFSSYYQFATDPSPDIWEQIERLNGKEKMMNHEQKYLHLKLKGTFYYHQQDLCLTIRYLTEAVEYAKELDINEGDIFYKISLTYSRLNRLTRSNSYAEKAIHIFQQDLDFEKVIDCYMVMGINYNLLGEYHFCEEYLHKIEAISPKFSTPVLQVSLYHNFGYCFYNQEKFELALSYLDKCLQVPNVSEKETLNSLYLMSKIYLKKEQKETASTFITKGFKIANHNQDQSYIYKFRVLIHELEEDESSDELETLLSLEVIPYFKKYGDRDDYDYYVKLLADTYYNNHKYKLASNYYRLVIY
ncbi:helix-turn-helix transcriptional regulator [Thalassobacillus sp. CUG 92003]|uniref:helix-turn-helix domain-containing protein n=1 Tax=Thalassobacillus sp. CUG 92003 TaxID=2736641 RepID=UPI0015E6D48A|nr:helix-turn-helix transcriptional regulator [Thalassobacillus sp. CUG 92003]